MIIFYFIFTSKTIFGKRRRPCLRVAVWDTYPTNPLRESVSWGQARVSARVTSSPNWNDLALTRAYPELTRASKGTSYYCTYGTHLQTNRFSWDRVEIRQDGPTIPAAFCIGNFHPIPASKICDT